MAARLAEAGQLIFMAGVMPGAVAQVFADAACEGLGDDNVTGVVQRYLRG